MKKDISLKNANRLINHGPVVLVTTQIDDKPNIFTAAWNMPISHYPPLAAISCGKGNYSFDIIEKTGEFIINIPDLSLVNHTFKCGTISGRVTDKFKETGLTAEPGKKVNVPSIKECIGHLEYKLVSKPEAGDHYIFIGEVVAAYADADKFNGTWITEKAQTIHHLGGTFFCSSGKTVQV